MFFYFTSLLTLSSGLNEIGFIKWVAEGYAEPLAGMTPLMGMILLVSFFFWIHFLQHHLACRRRYCRWCLRWAPASPPLGADADTLCVYSFGLMGDLALRDFGTRADVFRQRLHREGRFLEVRPDLWHDLFYRPPGDRAALAADDLSSLRRWRTSLRW